MNRIWRRHQGRHWRGRGSAAIEMAILMPVFVALFTTAVVIGRTANVISAVEVAAYDAARTASLARDYASAYAQAEVAVRRALEGYGVGCVNGPDLRLTPATAFDVAVGEAADVTASVTCQVTYVDVDLTGVPDDLTVSASFVSPLDQYRSRS